MNDTLTLDFDGDVSLEDFAQAVSRFRGIIHALQAEICPDTQIDWLLDDLQHGSALVTVRGVSLTPNAVERIADAFLDVGRALAAGRQISCSPRVVKEALGVTQLLDGTITSIRFETDQDDAQVVRPSVAEYPALRSSAYGAIEGRVEPRPIQHSLRFTLRDATHDRALACYVDSSQLDTIRSAGNRRIRVEGWVTRERHTGRPIVVRNIRRITVLDDVAPGTAIRAARCIAPLAAGEPSATDAVRRLRDG